VNQLIQHVSDTAFMVAGFRAEEHKRADALFRDPLAAKLAGEHGMSILKTVPKSFVGAWSVIIRTVIIDDYIREAVADGVDTILNLGAGFDTRPYRMDLPKTLHWIEVDYPHVITLKEERLTGDCPRCSLQRVSLDLTDHAARQAFFAEVASASKKMLVLTEGVVAYLTEPDVAALAGDLRALPNCRYWIVDYYSPEALRFGQKMRKRFMGNAPFRFTPEDWFGFFAAQGWRPAEVRYISEEADRLKRPLPASFWVKIRFLLRVPFMSKRRREQIKRYAAFVLLTPA
jgi:methyltransferase (TIGR00027 family)